MSTLTPEQLAAIGPCDDVAGYSCEVPRLKSHIAALDAEIKALAPFANASAWKAKCDVKEAEIAAYRKALETIVAMEPMMTMNPRKKVGDPSAIDYNYRHVAKKALGEARSVRG